MFVGFSGVKGYRLWHPTDKICINSRDVIFREEEMFMYQQPSKLASLNQNSIIEVELPALTKKNLESSIQETQEEDIDEHGETSQPLTEVIETSQLQTDLTGYSLARDRQRRKIVPPSRYAESNTMAVALSVAHSFNDNEPLSFQEAIDSPNAENWINAMNEEMTSLEINRTWTLVPLPKCQKVISSKWVYKYKEGLPGVQKPRYKARLVAKGFTQREGIDYSEFFSPIVKHTSIRVLLALVAQRGQELDQLDVKTAFLHGHLEEIIYLKQPEGYQVKRREEQVCLLNKSPYGLKQAPRCWYNRFGEFIINIGFNISYFDSCFYSKTTINKISIYLLL